MPIHLSLGKAFFPTAEQLYGDIFMQTHQLPGPRDALIISALLRAMPRCCGTHPMLTAEKQHIWASQALFSPNVPFRAAGFQTKTCTNPSEAQTYCISHSPCMDGSSYLSQRTICSCKISQTATWLQDQTQKDPPLPHTLTPPHVPSFICSTLQG